jgi:hypothetical protein
MAYPIVVPIILTQVECSLFSFWRIKYQVLASMGDHVDLFESL